MSARPEAPWESQQHVGRLLGPALALPLLAGLVAAAVALVPVGPAAGWLRAAVLLAAAAAVAAVVAAPVARWAACRLVLTATQVGVREGVLRRRERAVPLGRVVEVRTVQTALGRLLGHGTLVVVGEQGAEVRCDHLPAVRAVQALVLARAEAAGAGRDRGSEADDDEPGPGGHRDERDA